MALVPGMPKIPFLLLAAGTALLGKNGHQGREDARQAAAGPSKKKTEKEPVEDLLDMDRVSVHVGVRLIGMVDPRKSNTIFDRIGALRRQFAQQMGIIIPLVRLRDDLNLEPNAYEIRLSEIPVAKGFLEPDMFLAMDAGVVQQKIDGIKTTEPVYGLPALWITAAKKEAAELSGYTVIDPESVFITHLSETLKRHADELLTREDVQLLIDRLRKNQPSLVGEVVGTEGEVSIGLLQRVLRNLLRSSIPIRELTAILEALAENASKTKNVTTLTEIVRKSLSRTITEQYRDAKGKITAIAFDPAFEHQLTSSLRQEGGELILGVSGRDGHGAEPPGGRGVEVGHGQGPGQGRPAVRRPAAGPPGPDAVAHACRCCRWWRTTRSSWEPTSSRSRRLQLHPDEMTIRSE